MQTQEERTEKSDSKPTVTVSEATHLSSLKNYFDMLLSETTKSVLEEWRFQEKDEHAVICFRQGNRYEGRISRSIMHGQGTFYWADGGRYQVITLVKINIK